MALHSVRESRPDALGFLRLERIQPSPLPCTPCGLPVLVEVGVPERLRVNLHLDVRELGTLQQAHQLIWIGDPARFARPSQAKVIQHNTHVVSLRDLPGGYPDPTAWLQYSPKLTQCPMEMRKEHQAEAAQHPGEGRVREI